VLMAGRSTRPCTTLDSAACKEVDQEGPDGAATPEAPAHPDGAHATVHRTGPAGPRLRGRGRAHSHRRLEGDLIVGLPPARSARRSTGALATCASCTCPAGTAPSGCRRNAPNGPSCHPRPPDPELGPGLADGLTALARGVPRRRHIRRPASQRSSSASTAAAAGDRVGPMLRPRRALLSAAGRTGRGRNFVRLQASSATAPRRSAARRTRVCHPWASGPQVRPVVMRIQLATTSTREVVSSALCGQDGPPCSTETSTGGEVTVK
jgi:hypothetical protein